MAEVLGTFASGFAVVSLAIQIVETIQKLKTFHSLMQSAPADILLALDELEMLSMVLEEVDRSMQKQVFLDPGVKLMVIRSWSLCKTKTDGLMEFVTRLAEGVGRSKTRGKFKFAMKKGEMDVFRTRIESAKLTMQLANTTYYKATQDQRLESMERDLLHLQKSHESSHDIILKEILRPRPLIMEAPRTGGPDTQKPLSDMVETDVEEVVRDADEFEVSPRNKNCLARMRQQRSRVKTQDGQNYLGGLLAIVIAADEHNTASSISFGLPTWILARRFEFTLMKSRQGLDHSFRSYRSVSYDAKIFDYCMTGNVVGLKKLFAKGQASPFEIDPDGRTPLHYAALYAQPDICKLLLENGANVNVQTYWIGNLCKGLFEVGCGEGLCKFASNLPSEGIFVGWAAHCTPLHFLLSGGVLKSFGRSAFNHPDYLTVRSTSISQDFNTTVRTLAAYGADVMLEDQYSRTAFHSYTGPTSSFDWLVKDSEWDLKVMSPEHTIELVQFQILFNWHNDAEIVQHLLARNNDLKTLAHTSMNGFYIIHELISAWCYSTTYNISALKGLESLILDFIHAGTDLHLVSRNRETPFLALLIYSEDWSEATACVKGWLELLHRAGVDLEEYGQIENVLHNNDHTSWTFNYLGDRDYGQILQLRIGKTPDDFYIEFEDPYVCNYWAVDFWEGIAEAAEEERISAMPGGWCEH